MRLTFLLLLICSCSANQLKTKKTNTELPNAVLKEYVQFEEVFDIESKKKVQYLRHLSLFSKKDFTYNIHIVSPSAKKRIQLKGIYESSEKELKLKVDVSENFDCITKELVYVKKEGNLETPNGIDLIMEMQMDMRKRKPLKYNDCVDNIDDSYLTIFQEKESYYEMVPFKKAQVEAIIKD